MLIRNDKGFYTLSTWNQFKDLINAFSTREFGNMKPKNIDQKVDAENNFNKFLNVFKFAVRDVVRAEQVHSNKISVVNHKNAGQTIKNTDGLVTKAKNLLLAVFVADCYPIFAYDPEKEIIGAVHAGWRSSLLGISKNLIDSFKGLGSDTNKIYVGIGPGIEFCHYEVKKEIARKFEEAALGNSILRSISGKIYLDLKRVNVDQLVSAGVRKENIDVSIKACTYESGDFYSFRREGKNLSGEIAAVIGLPAGRQV